MKKVPVTYAASQEKYLNKEKIANNQQMTKLQKIR